MFVQMKQILIQVLFQLSAMSSLVLHIYSNNWIHLLKAIISAMLTQENITTWF